ncbi:MAG: hypothetical protein ACI9WC_000127 [Arenicella sp.]|jgi:hypothetical protein
MDVYKKQEDAIIVLGIGRSGTSMMSSLVQRWARYKGNPGKRTIIDPSNPKGYFESVGVQSVSVGAVSHLIQSRGISSWSPSFNKHLLSLVEDNTRFASALEYQFKRLRDVGVPWCSKAPILSVTVALWEHFVTDPVLVISVRNPYDTARSLLRLEDKKESKEGITLNLLLWQHYLIRILKDTAKFERRIFIHYEDIIENPELQLTKLAEFLAQQFPDNRNQESALREMMGMVEPKLHRNNSSVSFDERDEATQTQKELYALLKKITKDQIIPASIDYDKYQLTDQEISVLEKNNLHIISNLRRHSISKDIWNVCKYMVSRIKG